MRLQSFEVSSSCVSRFWVVEVTAVVAVRGFVVVQRNCVTA
jgi:hypothetical protein